MNGLATRRGQEADPPFAGGFVLYKFDLPLTYLASGVQPTSASQSHRRRTLQHLPPATRPHFFS
jgi:hypothetical protein